VHACKLSCVVVLKIEPKGRADGAHGHKTCLCMTRYFARK
jgi:hypothetical protein